MSAEHRELYPPSLSISSAIDADDDSQGIVILGSPIGTEDFMRRWLNQQVQHNGELIDKLAGMADAHCEFILIRACPGASRLNFVLPSTLTQATDLSAADFDKHTPPDALLEEFWSVTVSANCSCPSISTTKTTPNLGQVYPQRPASRPRHTLRSSPRPHTRPTRYRYALRTIHQHPLPPLDPRPIQTATESVTSWLQLITLPRWPIPNSRRLLARLSAATTSHLSTTYSNEVTAIPVSRRTHLRQSSTPNKPPDSSTPTDERASSAKPICCPAPKTG